MEVLVFDEADRLLQLGFSLDIAAILAAVPKQRRTGLFSATLTSELQRLMKTGMRNPVHVCVRRRPTAPANQTANASEPVEDAPDEPTRHELPAKLLNCFVSLQPTERLAFLVHF